MNVAGEVDHIIDRLEALKLRVKREEDETEYKNWIEGIPGFIELRRKEIPE